MHTVENNEHGPADARFNKAAASKAMDRVEYECLVARLGGVCVYVLRKLHSRKIFKLLEPSWGLVVGKVKFKSSDSCIGPGLVSS